MDCVHCPATLILSERRRGGFASLECFALLIVLALVCFAARSVGQFLVGSSQAGSAVKGSNESAVQKISVDHAGGRLWVYRSRIGLAQLNLATGAVEKSPMTAGVQITAVGFSRDGDSLLVCGLDGYIVLHREGEPSRIAQVAGPGMSQDLIFGAVVSHDGGVSLCATNSGLVHGWVCRDGIFREVSYRLPGGRELARIALNRCGSRLCALRDDGIASFHDSESGAAVGCELRVASRSADLAWTLDEQFLAVADGSGHVRVYELDSGSIALDLSDDHLQDSGFPMSLEISADQRWLALSTTGSSEIRIWSLETGQLAGTLRGHDALVATLQFSPGADRIYSGSFDGTVREWSVEQARLLRRID